MNADTLSNMNNMINTIIKSNYYREFSSSSFLDKTHFFILENDVLALLNPLITKNTINPRKMPFKTIFITNGFYLGGTLIKGIYLDSGGSFINELGAKMSMRDTDIFIIANSEHRMMQFPLLTYPELKQDIKGDWSNKDWKLLYTIRLFICNFLDFMLNPEVQIVNVERTKEQNLKRIENGKMPIPPLSYVRINGKLKLYAEELEKKGNEAIFTHRFWVRGHFRTLRNSRYGSNIGTKIWIAPFIKGRGILINKTYKVVSDEQEISRENL